MKMGCGRMYFLAVLLVPMSTVLGADSGKSYEHFGLRPQTSSFKDMLDATMQLAGDLEVLQERTLRTYNRLLIQDSAVGKLVRLWSTAQACMVDVLENGAVMRADDLVYVTHLVDRMVVLYKEVIPGGYYGALPQQLWSAIAQDLELIQGHTQLRGLKMGIDEF